MSTNAQLVNAVVELAMEMELTDPTDFAYVRVTEETSYKLLASRLIEDMSLFESANARELMLLATATHLMVENFILNQRLMQKRA